MILDAAALEARELPPVLIVGSGPAGVTLAADLARRGIRSLTLEGGDREMTWESQDLYIGEVIGDNYYALDACRLRFFGGTSNHWTGWCRHLDEDDFAARPDIGRPGWPIGKSDLDPWLAPAREVLEVPAQAERRIDEDLMEVTFAINDPVRFGEKYAALYDGDLADLALRTSVTALRAENGRIACVDVRTADDRELCLAPRIIVLACGGIENSRLLLWSNEVSGEPVVSDPASLGRYWMEHPHADVGHLDVHATGQQNAFPLGFFAPTPEAMRRHGILSGTLRTHPSRDAGLKGRIDGQACRLMRATPLDAAQDFAEDRCVTRIRAAWEQMPVADNRVSLSDSDRDRLGVPRPVLHWRKTDIDYRTIRVLFELYATHVLKNRLGAIRADRWIVEGTPHTDPYEPGGYHHIGGTRMAASARDGVVDPNLRVFGMANGYVVGSSVFPTSGHANPTQTIVQLALRLGDHLARRIPR